MEIQINDWLNASQDTGNPNVDGTDVNIVCSANTGNARSDSFEIMAGVLENGEPVDELRARVTVNQEKYVQKAIGGHINVNFGDAEESDINYIDGIVSLQVYINEVDVTGYYSYDTNGAGYTLDISKKMTDIIEQSNTSANIRFFITVDTTALKRAGYNQIRILTTQSTSIQLVVNGEYNYFDIPERIIYAFTPTSGSQINAADTYTGLNLASVNMFLLDGTIDCYLS